MYLINNTNAQVTIPVKSQNRTITLAKGETSEEISDKLHNELVPFIRAFGLSTKGFVAQHGSVVRKHSENTVVSDPKANSGAAKAKAREEKANADAAAKAQAVKDAAAKNKAAQDAAAAKKAEAATVAEDAPKEAAKSAPAKTAPAKSAPAKKTATKPETETKATSTPKSQTGNKRRRSTLGRKTSSK